MSRGKWVLRLAFSAVILIFLAYYLYSNSRDLFTDQWHFRAGPLALSLVVLLAAEAMFGVFWHLIFLALGTRVSLRTSFRSVLLGQLAKYVPGKVFTLMARIHLMGQGGAREETTVVAQVIEAAALCVSGVLVGGVWGLTVPELRAHGSFRALFLVIPVGLLLMHPVVLRRPVAFLARKLGRADVELRASYASLLGITLCYTLSWVAFGVGLYCLSAAGGTTPASVWDCVGAYALAWVAGFVSIVAPGGLGVREATLGALLSRQLGGPPAMALALLARVWVTVGEIICAAAVSNFRIRSLFPHGDNHNDRATKAD